jgi:hypothetical protein
MVTHPRISMPPTTPAQAVEQVRVWIESPSLLIEGEPPDHRATLRDTLLRPLWGADRDFTRFSGPRTASRLLARGS